MTGIQVLPLMEFGVAVKVLFKKKDPGESCMGKCVPIQALESFLSSFWTQSVRVKQAHSAEACVDSDFFMLGQNCQHMLKWILVEMGFLQRKFREDVFAVSFDPPLLCRQLCIDWTRAMPKSWRMLLILRMWSCIKSVKRREILTEILLEILVIDNCELQLASG